MVIDINNDLDIQTQKLDKTKEKSNNIINKLFNSNELSNKIIYNIK